MKAMRMIFTMIIVTLAFQMGVNASRYAENLSRGINAVKTSDGILVSWRLLGNEDYDTNFALYRDGELIAQTDKTNYLDESGNIDQYYQVAPVNDGIEGEKSEWKAAYPTGTNYFDIPIQKPEPATVNGNKVEYTSYDAACGDTDGDGNYEIILMWAAGAVDNSQDGFTGNVIIDAYKLDGTLLWRIDLGPNIRAGAHYTQMIAGDFNNDGKCELALKTAPGSKDGKGNYVSSASSDPEINNTDNSIDYRDSSGRILSGAEYFTVFAGEDGSAIDTIAYPIPRGNVSDWGDDYGNRVDRFLGCSAYLDGESQSIVTWRGYYTRMTAVAYDLKDGKLVERCRFDTNEAGKEYEQQGNHSILAADVDDDGKDEVISGSICLDDDFSVLWCSYRSHGDAHHIGWYDKNSKIPTYFSVHEETGTEKPDGSLLDAGMTVYNAATGEELFHAAAGADTPRGMMGNFGMGGNYQFWGIGAGSFIHNDDGYSQSDISGSSSFRIFWDGDIYDELLDGKNENGYAVLSKYSQTSGTFYDVMTTQKDGGKVINGTKKTPMLQADLFGDWREEFVLKLYGDEAMRVYSTNIYTDNKLYTLMHDMTYRTGVAAEPAGYNQPPHIGYYLSEDGDDGRYDKPDIKFAAALPEIDIPEESPHKPYVQDKNKIIDFEGSLPSTNSSIVGGSVKTSQIGDVVWSYSGGPYGYLAAANIYHAAVKQLENFNEKDGNFLIFASNAKSKSAVFTAKNSNKSITEKGVLSFDVSYPATFSTDGTNSMGNNDSTIYIGDGALNALEIKFVKSEYALYANGDLIYNFADAADAQSWRNIKVYIDRVAGKAVIRSDEFSKEITLVESEPINIFSVRTSTGYRSVLMDNIEMYEIPEIKLSIDDDLVLTVDNQGADIAADMIIVSRVNGIISDIKINDHIIKNGTGYFDISEYVSDNADMAEIFIWDNINDGVPMCEKTSIELK